MNRIIENQEWTIEPDCSKTWANITREERYFCALLFEYIKKDTSYFVDWLNKYTNIKLNLHCEWEVGYEVCFYRDWFKSKGQSARKLKLPWKRTFDLCLFSKTDIIIIEAKAQQPFNKKQIELLVADVDIINKMFNSNGKQLSIKLIALASTEWVSLNLGFYGNPFNEMITWKQIDDLYHNKMFVKADDLYGK